MKKRSLGARFPLVVICAVTAVVLVVVGIAAGIGLSGGSGEGELLAERSLGECSVEIYGYKPALFPDGFLRVKILCRQGGSEAVADERTFAFAEGGEMFSFSGDSAALRLTVHDTHGDIVYDIIPTEIFG